jgi:hypothetical protein
MTSELTPLEKIHKAKKCFVWVADLNGHIMTTKKEAMALHKKYLNTNKSNNYRWHLEYVQVFGEYWLYIN